MKYFIFCLLFLSLYAPAWDGKEVYDKYCSQCHNDTGDGNGIAYDYVLPKPRDFTTGVFKFRTTANEHLPLEQDLIRVITKGIPGTSMPAFAQIGDTQIKEVATYIQTFFKAKIDEGPWPAPEVAIGTPPAVTDEMIAKGRQAYVDNGCIDCHGHDGRADGPSSPTLEDDYGNPIKAANLTASWRFRGGDSLTDIYRAFSTGLAGTPMPSYIESMPDDNDRWAISAFVRSMAPPVKPEASAQVIAAMRETLPETVEDEVWATIEPAWFPLSGQVIWEPINTDPTVFGVKVRALHNGGELVMLVEWDDPSFSSSALAAAAPVAAAGDDEDDWDDQEEDDFDDDDFGDDEEEAGEPAVALDDSFAVQFPTGMPKGNERPYFVMGDSKYGVNLWHWTNSESVVASENKGEGDWARYYKEFGGDAAVANRLASGREDIRDMAAGQAINGKVRYRNGSYSLLLRRKLVSLQAEGAEAAAEPDPAGEVQLVPGQFVPVAFWAWDGSNGEQGAKASLSAWYFLVLEQPVGSEVYYKTAGAVVILFLLQLLAVRLAKAGKPAETTAVEAEATT